MTANFAVHLGIPMVKRMFTCRGDMHNPPVRLMVVDGQDAIRRGVRDLFESKNGYRVVADVRDGCEALRLARRLKPDLAIVGYVVPSLGGLELLYAMRRAGLETKVLIYTMFDNSEVVSNILEAGVRAFVLKSEPEDSLVEAVEAL